MLVACVVLVQPVASQIAANVISNYTPIQIKTIRTEIHFWHSPQLSSITLDNFQLALKRLAEQTLQLHSW